MRKKNIYFTIIVLVLGVVGTVFFNAANIDTSQTSLGETVPSAPDIFNKNICQELNSSVNFGGRVYQYEDKILEVESYDEARKIGRFRCIASNQIEPFIEKIQFSCLSEQLAVTRWRVMQKCRGFTKAEIKCSQYNDAFDVDIERINYTKFKHDNITYAFDSPSSDASKNVVGRDEIYNQTSVLPGEVSRVNTLQSGLLMGAMVCSIVNNGGANKISNFCLKNPNKRQCYGKFDHSFVNFPEHYFPTHEGSWQNSTPGYTGINTFPDELDTNSWSYFEFNNLSGNYRLETDIGVRYNPLINVTNYNNLSSYSMSPFNPDNPGNMEEFELSDYHQISSYYYQAAREEIKSFLQQNRKNTPQYYYDHLPRLFKGYGSKLSNYKNSSVFDTTSNHPFQAICDNGCRHLVITSHERCESDYQSTPIDTEVHCLPKYLNLRVNFLFNISDSLFDISGYESVRIEDLVFSVTPGTKYVEIINEVSEQNGSYEDYFNYLLPRLSYVFSGENIVNLSSDTQRQNNPSLAASAHEVSFNNVYYNYLFKTYNDLIQYVSPNVANMINAGTNASFDFFQASVMAYFFHKKNIACRNTDLSKTQNPNGDVITANTSSCGGSDRQCSIEIVTNTCGNIVDTFMGNLHKFSPAQRLSMSKYLTSLKRVFIVHNTDKLLVTNNLFKSVSTGLIAAGARKSIFHGNKFQGYLMNDLIRRNVPILSEKIGIKNYFQSGVDSSEKYEGDYENLYFAPIFIGSGNWEGHIRLDESRLANFDIDYENEYPFIYNLCKSLNGTNPNPQYCDPEYNFSTDHKFSIEEFFSPFYFSPEAPEVSAKADSFSVNHYDNNVYLKKFNPVLEPTFLLGFDADPDAPMNFVQSGNVTRSDYKNIQQCTTSSDCGEDAYCFTNTSYPNGLCLQGSLSREYIVISNNTFSDHSFRGIIFYKNDPSGDTINEMYNHEFISTNNTHSLIFNNILKNHRSDIYDLNFRGTAYRSDKNKNLVQVIERNIISNGSNGKATGEGNPESKMKFSNNIINDVRIGGYHAFFTPFYLNNTILSNGPTILNDTQNRFANYEAIKPYGVRHALFNNAIIRFTPSRSIISSGTQRMKQHAVDYNFAHNLYFGEVTGNWLGGADYTEKEEPGYFDVNIPMANHSYINQDGVSLLFDEESGNSLSCFGNYLFGGTNSDCSDSLTDFSTDEFLYGSFEGHLYDSSLNPNHGFNYGKVILENINGVDLAYGYSPSLSSFYRAGLNKFMPRVRFISKGCYGLQNGSQIFTQRDISEFRVSKNNFLDKLGSYECVTGDNKSTFIQESDINNANKYAYETIADSIRTKGAWGFTNDIKNIVGPVGCNEIQDKLSKDKRPSIIVTEKGLSVYRDFMGRYRAPKSSVGSFDVTCSN